MIIGVSNRKDIICSPQAAGFWKGRKCIMSKKIINFLRKYKYMILVLYFPIYMLWFNWLERRQVPHFAMIHCRLDDMIPFCEWFAIPYFLWFLYVFVSIIFLFLQSKHMSDFRHDYLSDHLYHFSKCSATPPRCYAKRQFSDTHRSRSL